MFVLNKNKNSRGFTAAEILVAMGWSSVILLAAFSGVYAVMGQNHAAKAMINDNEFVAALSQEISLPGKCTPSVTGQKLPSLGGKGNLTLTNYSGFGSGGLGDNTVTAPAGAPYNLPGGGGQNRLVEFTMERKNGTGTEDVNGITLNKHYLVVNIGTEIFDTNMKAWRARTQRKIQVPVLVNPATDQIATCTGGNIVDAATPINCKDTLGGTPAKDGTCVLSTNDFRGFYVTKTPVGSTAAECRMPNPLSGGCNCPPSSADPRNAVIAYQSGSSQFDVTTWYSAPCGKKGMCSYPSTAYFYDTYYICVDNNKKI